MLSCCSYFLNLVLGHESAQEEPDEPSSVCSSPGEETSYYEEETTYSLELTDQYALDGEVEKRLNQMVPIPVSLLADNMMTFFFSCYWELLPRIKREFMICYLTQIILNKDMDC